MRPGRVRPGNPVLFAKEASPSSGPRFNEAGAGPPRKFRPSREAGLPDPCFNEAGAGPPRKSDRPTRLQ